MVCQVKLVGNNSRTTVTFELTTTGAPRPWYTVVGGKNLKLPTVNLQINEGVASSPSKVLTGLMACFAAILSAGPALML